MKNTKVLAALLLSSLVGLAHAGSSVELFTRFEGSISGWSPVDDDNDSNNGPYYPEPQSDGYGGYGANVDWPGDSFHGLSYGRHGWYSSSEGVDPFVAGITVNGGRMDAILSFPSDASGSAATFGIGTVTYTLLPGATLTFGGSWGANWLLESNVSGYYSLSLTMSDSPYWDEGQYQTLWSSHRSFSSGASESAFGEATFTFTNNTDLAIEKSFALDGTLYFGAAQPPVTPVPEPETYAMMLAGLATLALVGRRRMRNQPSSAVAGAA